MSYRIQPSDASLTGALRRIAGEQIGAAIAETRRPVSEARDAVHNIRKHCKKLRGLFRLMRTGFAGYATENAAARDIARMSSSLRDADVLLETHDLVTEKAKDAARYDRIRMHLVHAAEDEAPAGDVAEALGRQRAALEAMLERSKQWEVTGKAGKVLKSGLSKTWLRAAAAMKQSHDNAPSAAFHDWRKRVKYHWYHSRLMQGVRPGQIRAHRKEAKALADLLGDHHDLTVYLAWLDGLEVPGDDPETLASLRRLAAHRQEKLARKTWRQGARLMAGPPKALPKRWQAWWRLSRKHPSRS